MGKEETNRENPTPIPIKQYNTFSHSHLPQDDKKTTKNFTHQ